jgi:hypothetical protein
VDPGWAFDLLDAFEGPDFTRQIVPVHQETAELRRAWVYLFNKPVDRLPRIASGRFASA